MQKLKGKTSKRNGNIEETIITAEKILPTDGNKAKKYKQFVEECKKAIETREKALLTALKVQMEINVEEYKRCCRMVKQTIREKKTIDTNKKLVKI